MRYTPSSAASPKGRQISGVDVREVVVIGGGLAGTEAAWQVAQRGVHVDLIEMRPTRMTEAHTTSNLAELVCSNSFGSNSPHTASWILKAELNLLGSLILEEALRARVPAGQSLAVDRERFSEALSKRIAEQSNITIHRAEISEIPEDKIVIVATGPLTTPGLAKALGKYTGENSLYFYDAISPILSAESLDRDKMFAASRYGKGEPDFLNIPLDQAQYDHLIDELLAAEVVLPHDFEEEKYFESCMPIEALAARGRKTLAFGPMKPVGLTNPKTGHRPYAVIQLRTENRHFSSYNLVGFQTKMKYGEQLRVFRQLPGLENAEFLRHGSMHRNTYIDSPRLLAPTLQFRNQPNLFVAGQLTGTEGYLESTATGCLAGINAARLAQSRETVTLPSETILGSLLETITDPARHPFQPMNVNLGLFPPLGVPMGKKDKAKRNACFAERSLVWLKSWVQRHLEAEGPEGWPSAEKSPEYCTPLSESPSSPPVI